jgi:tRNA threonylcarbamoyladenosine biosynthesis protein TsaE
MFQISPKRVQPINRMEKFTARTVEETKAVGRVLAHRLQAGDMLLLRGSLGAGKSVLTRGIVEALGVTDWAGSPSFALVHEYVTQPPLYHIDLYRLSDRESQEIGLEEYARPDSIVIVEWANRSPKYLSEIAPRPPIWVDVLAAGDGRRTIAIHEPARHKPAPLAAGASL